MLAGLLGSSKRDEKATTSIVDDDADAIISDGDSQPARKKPSKTANSKKPARALKNAAPADEKVSRWEATKSERERTRKIKALNKELRSSMEVDSSRIRTDQKRQREEKIQKEKQSMKVEKVSKTRAMKKLSPRVRRRLGIFAQHELSKMVEDKNRR
ncbi:inactive serine protease PAMR1-like protein [Perkinsela sp. CCAP 1560/4]|nr:inactive serine protease PAMR1-like protein [Perkinsela sp. CCAP 1560/4]|eukprot:KNH06235.1 inactive serine protease PAMR1-like protein [Perkinsela sp. CCAP 1560/4]